MFWKKEKTYRNPVPTVDIIIELKNGIVLIERKNPPHGWAIPGGFVDYGESLEDAARREAQEETGLSVRLKSLLYTYSNPARDPRRHTISTVFVADARGVPVAADDAKNLAVFDLKKLPHELAFDHRQILSDYLKFRKSGSLPKPR
ncbi:MAG: NUDIX hydrolase [Leptospiraceae bacterium]|nr:NUDIX hydrolase [Leptospiraceae bacterium]